MDSYEGVVIEGSKRARELGYPTINIECHDAAPGVYVASVVFDGTEIPAAAFSDPTRGILEAHLLGFERDLYGQKVAIALREKIRETKKYESDEDLKAAIAQDVSHVREYFHL